MTPFDETRTETVVADGNAQPCNEARHPEVFSSHR